jgi:hypothetical protein
MPKVKFVKEHRTVEVEKGVLISKAAEDLGIATCRESFVGTGIGDYTCWVKGEPGCVSEPGFFEKLFGHAKGWRRQANKARILGDVEIWTQAGPDARLRSPRPVARPPRPLDDAEAARLPVDASGSAAFPYGNPVAVGKGERAPIGRTTGKPKVAGAKGAAAAEDTDDEAEDGDEEESA